MEPQPPWPYRGLLAAVFVAAVLQALIVARSPMVTADGIKFASIAQHLAHAPLETMRAEDQHPGYPALMLAATRLVQTLGYRAEPEAWEMGGQAVAFVAGLLAVWVVWQLAREMFDVAAANAAAMIFAVLPVARQTSADALSDMPHALFYLLAAWLGIRGARAGSWRLVALAGAASGLAFWIRPEGLQVAAIVWVCVAFEAIRMRWGWQRGLATTGALAAATLLVAAPYPLLAGKLTSKQLPRAKIKLAEAYARQEKPSDASQAPPPVSPQPAPLAAAPAVVEAPSPAPSPAVVAAPPLVRAEEKRPAIRPVGRALESLAYCLGQGLKVVFIPCYLVGQFWVMPFRRPALVHVLVLALLGAVHMGLLVALYCFAGYIAHRHVLPLVAIAMPATALGLIYFGEKLARFRLLPQRYAVPALLAVCAALVVPYTIRPFCIEFLPVREATAWVQAQAPAGSGVVTNSPYVDFFGSLPVTVLNDFQPTLDDALRAGGPARFDYVVLHVGAHDYHPEWLPAIQARYSLVREYDEPPNARYRPRKVLVFASKARVAQRAGE